MFIPYLGGPVRICSAAKITRNSQRRATLGDLKRPWTVRDGIDQKISMELNRPIKSAINLALIRLVIYVFTASGFAVRGPPPTQ